MNCDIYYKIQEAAALGSMEFPSELTKILRNHFNAKAVTFYTPDINETSLILKGQTGFEYSDYQSFELPLNTVAGKCFTERRSDHIRDLQSSYLYRDKQILAKYHLTSVHTYPLILSSKATNYEQQVPTGVICIYPYDEYDQINYDTETLFSFIARSYYLAIEKLKISMRDEIINKTSHSADLNSALHKIIGCIKKSMLIEAASVFIYDEKLKQLKLHATSGINGSYYKDEIYYTKEDPESWTWETYDKSMLHTINDISLSGQQGKFMETVRNKPKSFFAIPIQRIEKKNNSKPRTSGVLRLINKELKYDHKTETISFSAEDKEVLLFITDILSIIIHMFMSREKRVAFFEKIMHGTKSNITTSLQNLDILKRTVLDMIPAEMTYTITDTIDWLLDIKNQMERLESINKVQIKEESVKLGGSVLSKAVSLFEKGAKSAEVKEFSITNLRDGGFFQLPEILGDIDALRTVFRNLVENTLKYRDYDKMSCNVKLSYKEDRDSLYIYYEDDGIGIPVTDKYNIFEEGFRSDNAVKQDPASTGLGLTQSQEIMHELKGDLYLENNFPTTFCVKLRKA